MNPFNFCTCISKIEHFEILLASVLSNFKPSVYFIVLLYPVTLQQRCESHFSFHKREGVIISYEKYNMSDLERENSIMNPHDGKRPRYLGKFLKAKVLTRDIADR